MKKKKKEVQHKTSRSKEENIFMNFNLVKMFRYDTQNRAHKRKIDKLHFIDIIIVFSMKCTVKRK